MIKDVLHMIVALILSLSVTVGLTVLSLIFKVAGKLRLGIPLLYFLAAVISTFFTDWTTKNEQLVLIGLYVLIALVVLSWIISLIKVIKGKTSERALSDLIAWQIQKARESGIDTETVTFDENGIMRDRTSGKIIEVE